jgi:hypothetical protein
MSLNLNLPSESAVIEQDYRNNQQDVVRVEALSSYHAALDIYQQQSNYTEPYFQGRHVAYFESYGDNTAQLVQNAYCDAYAQGAKKEPFARDALQDQINNICIDVNSKMNLDHPLHDPLTRGRIALRDVTKALKAYRTQQAGDRAQSLAQFAYQQGLKSQLNLG